jgi:hypothetical protein
MNQHQTRPPLGPGLWFFIVTRVLGIILNAAFLVFSVVSVLPTVAASEGGAGYAGDIVGEILLPIAEIVATVVGLALVVRRSPSVRRYWLVCLSVFCVAQLWEVFAGLEPAGAFFFFAVGLGWLAYWVWAPRARQLPLEGFWAHPESVPE